LPYLWVVYKIGKGANLSQNRGSFELAFIPIESQPIKFYHNAQARRTVLVSVVIEFYAKCGSDLTRSIFVLIKNRLYKTTFTMLEVAQPDK